LYASNESVDELRKDCITHSAVQVIPKSAAILVITLYASFFSVSCLISAASSNPNTVFVKSLFIAAIAVVYPDLNFSAFSRNSLCEINQASLNLFNSHKVTLAFAKISLFIWSFAA